jgi:eukaryotic-like serine/threonine-protein kinase
VSHPSFGPYEVLEQVASGSTGTVYRARHLELDRVVAIKELNASMCGFPGLLDRFRAEAQMLADLDHEHIVAVYDYVEEAGRAWIVEEWVVGAALDEVMSVHGQLTPQQAVGSLRGALLGLAYAHERGLIHRDIAPNNIVADEAGTSKLLDFGLAAPVGAVGVCGTPAYVSPEAATGTAMGKPSDVYSAGAVLYTLLAGAPPYPAANPAQAMRAHMDEPVPSLRGHGRELAGVVRHAMAKDASQRPPDAAALLAELEDAAEKRFGAGWLAAAAMGGVVASVLESMGAAAGTAVGVGSAPQTVVVTRSAVDTGSGPTSAGGAGDGSATTEPAGGAARRGRSLRRLRTKPALAVAAGVVVVAAVGGVALAGGGGGGGDDPAKQAAIDAAGEGDVEDAAAAVAARRAVLLPDGEYTFDLRTTATDSPRERVGGRFKGPGTLDMECAATCTGTLVLDAGVTYTVAFNGTTLTLAFTIDRELQNVDTEDKPLPGTHVERQISEASLAAASDAAQTPFVGTMHTTVQVTEWNGPDRPDNFGPWFTDYTLKLIPLSGDTATSPVPTASATPGDAEISPQPAEPTAGPDDTAAPVTGDIDSTPGVG